MSTLLSESRDEGTWLGTSVFRLDAWLRRRHGVFEYSDSPDCLFRIQRSLAHAGLRLGDGTCVRRGDPVLDLHLWNEQLPPMPKGGPTMAWARRLGYGIARSLKELAHYLRREPSLDDIVALRAGMRLGTPGQNAHIVRLSGRYGFEEVDATGRLREGLLRRLGDNAMGLLLVLAANPAAARPSVLWRDSVLIYMSRATLEGHALPRQGVTDRERSAGEDATG